METTRSPRLPSTQPGRLGADEHGNGHRHTGSKRGHRPGLAGFGGLSAREKWGYGVWLFVGLVFGVPESWAGITNPPRPALSDTIAHLESLWAPTAVIVVALIVFIVFAVTGHPLAQATDLATPQGEPGQRRTANGRLTRCQAEAISHVPVLVYFPCAVCAVAGGSLLAATASSDMYVLGYVIYGLFAIFLVIIPNVMAFWFAREVPFPTLACTVADLERRWRPAAMIIVAGLVILMIHLAFAPWPDIFRHIEVAPAHR